MNLYGYTCADLVAIHKLDFEAEREEVTPSAKRARLERSISELLHEWSLNKTDKEKVATLSEALGRCFLIAGEPVNAAICFEETVTRAAEGEIKHKATCDNCSQDIIGTRLVCLQCPNGDLCMACHKLYVEGREPSSEDEEKDGIPGPLPVWKFCKDHDFLRIPRGEWYRLDGLATVISQTGLTKEQWLDDLVKERCPKSMLKLSKDRSGEKRFASWFSRLRIF